MRRGRIWIALAFLLIAVLVLSACSAERKDETTSTTAEGATGTTTEGTTETTVETATLVDMTPAGTEPVDSVIWATYRDVSTLDPIYAFDYPDNTAVSLMYESLLRQNPDGTIGPGLAAATYPDETTLVLDLNPDAKFWDGNPVTAEDVVFSIARNLDPELGGFYGGSFDRVASYEVTGDKQVTITLTEPDYWLEGELASVPGVVLEKAVVETQGGDYGTPAGQIMGTGAYKFGSWDPAEGVKAVANPDYWDSSVEPLVSEILLKGVPAAASVSSGLVTGGIQGTYLIEYSILQQLEQDPAVTVTRGPGWATECLVISNLEGALGDVRVRQALSLALDRQAIIDSVYKGAATIPRWLTNPGTFGYAQDAFDTAYAESPALEQDLEKAKTLIEEAGATGKTITIGMSNEIANISSSAGAYRTAAEAIGLKVEFQAVSAQNYIYYFIDPSAREGVDAFPTLNYGDYADPALLLSTVVLPNGSQNYSGYDNPDITSLLLQARSTADPDERAVVEAEALTLAAEDLPWIPTVCPQSILVTSKSLSGAVASFAYMFTPWANDLGGVQ
ncbi:MAG: ABC transporter substrate-binding protein [Thermoleophilia bacterium]